MDILVPTGRFRTRSVDPAAVDVCVVDPASVPLVNGWVETNPASQGSGIDAGYVIQARRGAVQGWVDFALTPNPYEETSICSTLRAFRSSGTDRQ